MTQRLATIAAAMGFAVVSLAASGDCDAMWEVRYEGPDQITLVERPNSAGRNLTRSGAHEKELAKGRLASALEPILANAFDPCVPKGSGVVTVKPVQVIDRIGDTSTRMAGLGIYLNLPDADRVAYGNFYLAPFFAVTVTFAPEGGPAETAELYEFNRVEVDSLVNVTQEKFIETPAGNLMPTILDFMKKRLPSAMHKAFPGRCPAA